MKKLRKPETFASLITPEQVATNYGFVYRITVNNRSYIGQKSFSLGTPWQSYQSSSAELKALLAQPDANPVYEVLALAKTKRALTYLEASFQFKFDVLTDSSYLNKNVIGKFYRNVLI